MKMRSPIEPKDRIYVKGMDFCLLLKPWAISISKKFFILLKNLPQM